MDGTTDDDLLDVITKASEELKDIIEMFSGEFYKWKKEHPKELQVTFSE